jgi:FdhD protein
MSSRPPFAEAAPVVWRGSHSQEGRRAIPEETPIAITYDGTTHAVMMATPQDLEDFAIGFSVSEDIIESLNDIDSLDIVSLHDGVEARIWLKQQASRRHVSRRRKILGPTGCGLCGVDSIVEAIKPAPAVHGSLQVTPQDLFRAMTTVQALQTLNARTRAVHAAALCSKDGSALVREDVGRHNALDKVVGAVVRSNLEASDKFVFLTSRVSVELVQKTARLGAPLIAAVSAPTALAARLAESARITIAAVLRDDGFEVFTCPERIVEEVAVHGA